jgi:hypothetical protein
VNEASEAVIAAETGKFPHCRELQRENPAAAVDKSRKTGHSDAVFERYEDVLLRFPMRRYFDRS